MALGQGAMAAAAPRMGDAATAWWAGEGEPGFQTHPARAKHVIFLHMAGSPPQHDLWDHKPMLRRYDRKPCPEAWLEGERFAFIKGHPEILASPYRFSRFGETGTEVSELLPFTSQVVDKLAIVRSMHTEQFNHAPAQMFLHTGAPQFGRPCLGSWALYGLGSENRDLPGFVVMVSGGKLPSAGKSVWGNGFLPTGFQGVKLRSTGSPVLYLEDPEGMDRELRRTTLDALGDLNALGARVHGDPETAARTERFELAFRMQAEVPRVADLSAESPETLALYGAQPGAQSFANNCLLARRLVEQGVRFVQLFDWGWDNHGTNPSDDIITQLPLKCRETDRPIAALIADLDRRGLLDETLIVWGGEFGRTPLNEARNGSKFLGRDHHPHCFTMWMCGGGAQAGARVGATDELGYHVAEDPVHVHDLQATILHLLGINHEKLTHRFQGRDFRLTDVAGRVVPQLLASSAGVTAARGPR